MIRLSYSTSGNGSGEREVTFREGLVRFGRWKGCEVCLAPLADERIAPYHGEFREEQGSYFVLARHGIWVNGERVQCHELKGGERVALGSADGPSIRVLEVGWEEVSFSEEVAVPPELLSDELAVSMASSSSATEPGFAIPPRELARYRTPPPPPIGQRSPAVEGVPLGEEPEGSLVGKLSRGMQSALRLLGRKDPEVEQWLTRAQGEILKARQRSRGASSGDTMVIMAKALTGLRRTEEGRTRRWRRWLLIAVSLGLFTVGALSCVVWFQQRRIEHMIAEKHSLDEQIQAVFAQMAAETDEKRLAELEALQQQLMGKAAAKLSQVRHASPNKAEALAAPADELELEIRRILRAFNAETYAIPPIFKDKLKAELEELRANKALKSAYARRERYWPKIQGALKKHGLPEELGYITYTESRFDPTVISPKGAAGLWQLMEETARGCGLKVTPELDERFDPARSSVGAACYLSRLLIEFGEESFMLVLASYNRGEYGVRRALHRVAKEPGGFRINRDFWHLYRLKLLPDETREYVPNVIAAAIVFTNPKKYGILPEELDEVTPLKVQ